MKRIILPFVAALVSFAQPQIAARETTALKAFLNLSDTQLTSITTANRTAMESSRTLRTQIDTKQEALRSLLASGSTDASAIGRIMLEIQGLRKQVDSAQANLRAQATSFLTTDQKTKLKTLEDAEKLRDEIREAHSLQLLAPSGEQRGGGIGPGGPGPRGPRNFNH